MDLCGSFRAVDWKRQVCVTGTTLGFDRTPDQKIGLNRRTELGLNSGGFSRERDSVLVRLRLFDEGKNEKEDRCNKAANE